MRSRKTGICQKNWNFQETSRFFPVFSGHFLCVCFAPLTTSAATEIQPYGNSNCKGGSSFSSKAAIRLPSLFLWEVRCAQEEEDKVPNAMAYWADRWISSQHLVKILIILKKLFAQCVFLTKTALRARCSPSPRDSQQSHDKLVWIIIIWIDKEC